VRRCGITVNIDHIPRHAYLLCKLGKWCSFQLKEQRNFIDDTKHMFL